MTPVNIKRVRVRVLLSLMAFALALTAIRLWPKAPLRSRYTSSTAIFDARGKLLRLTLADDDRYRLWLPLDQIAPEVVEAFLLKEDHWFYWHPGVNPAALARGGWRTYAAGKRQGGSTITMQLARLMDGRNTRTAAGKLRQAGRALALEMMYSKREILEAYLNLVPFGGNVEGVGAASLIYFAKSTKALALQETLTLAVIPQSPAQRASGAAAATAVSARLRLFEAWSREHPDTAIQRGLMSVPINMRSTADLPFLAPHAVNALLGREAAGSRADREIRSTIDLSLQRTLERQVRSYIERSRRTGIDNAAVMLVDYRSMDIKAVVGSAGFFNKAISGQVDGTLAKRSPGSTLKPFIYALAMDQGLIHPLSVLKDAPVSFGPFSPENFDGTFSGPITARDALIRSRNVPAVALSAQLSSPSLYDFLESAGVERLAPERHYGLALALGGGDVTMEELASLYAVLANRGLWHPLRRRAADPAGEPVRLLSEEASYMTLDILRGNPRPEGVMQGAHAGPSVAWKTGTSWGFRDAWSAGIFGPYVLVVWIGNFSGQGNPAFVGLQAAAPLFFQIVDGVAAEYGNLADPSAAIPRNLVKIEVCTASGDLPNPECPLRSTTWFVPGKSPIRVSSVHRSLTIDRRTGRIACAPYDKRFVEKVVYEYWPSDLMRLFAQAGMPRRAPPVGECSGTADRGFPPSITAPIRGASYLARESQPERNYVPLAAVADADVESLYWFANDSFVGAAKPNVAASWKPSHAGRYLLRVVDDHGRSDSREVVVTVLE